MSYLIFRYFWCIDAAIDERGPSYHERPLSIDGLHLTHEQRSSFEEISVALTWPVRVCFDVDEQEPNCKSL